MTDTYHIPVMAQEVIEWLALKPGQTIIDATLGGGGHSAMIAKQIGESGKLIGVDQDLEAIDAAGNRLRRLKNPPSLSLIRSRFDSLRDALAKIEVAEVDGILFDLGVSSHQLDEPSRGFSFKEPDAPLDMRMNPHSGEATASDLLNSESKDELTRIFRDYADEKWAARIAEFVIKRRETVPFAVAGDLVETVKAAVPVAARAKEIHPATRVFQALRIAVNDEYGVLQRGLEQGMRLLREGDDSRIVVISYHSGEDRIVKRLFGRWSGRCECPPIQPVCTCGALNPEIELLTKRPLSPSADEIARNPRARSAKMRVAKRR